jgi:hypothetical protein
MISAATAVRPDSSVSRKKLLLVLPLVLLMILAFWLLLGQFFRAAAPSPEQWLEAAEHVQQNWQSGDMVRIEPAWLTAGRVYFGDVDGGSREPFRILDLHDPVDPAWLYRYKRLWLVLAVEARSEWEELVPLDLVLEEEVEFPGISLLRFAIPQGKLRWQMLEALPDARVVRQGSDGPVKCKWRGQSHRCKMKGAMDVQRKLRRVAGSARQCVNINVGPGTEPTTLTFGGLTGPGTLLVRVGNTIEAARAKDGGDVTATVVLDEEEHSSLLLDKRSYVLEEVTIPLADGREKELVIRLRATDDKKREICLDGYIIGDEIVP